MPPASLATGLIVEAFPQIRSGSRAKNDVGRPPGAPPRSALRRRASWVNPGASWDGPERLSGANKGHSLAYKPGRSDEVGRHPMKANRIASARASEHFIGAVDHARSVCDSLVARSRLIPHSSIVNAIASTILPPCVPTVVVAADRPHIASMSNSTAVACADRERR